MERILKYVETSDIPDAGPGDPAALLPYRLVCRLWNQIATSLYKSKQQVEVGSYSTSVPRLRRLVKLYKGNPHFTRKRSSLPSLYSSWPCAFAKFRLCQEVFQPMYTSVITDFFQTFQYSLEVLDIWLDLRSTLSEIPIHTKATLCSFPNLKTLLYDDRRVILAGTEDMRGVFLKNLTKLAPSLRTLSFRFQRDFRGSVECGNEVLFRRLRHMLAQVQIQKSLKFLKLDLHLNDQLLNCLKCCNLRLETLEVAIRGSKFTCPVFQEFLETQQMCLNKLKISFIERDSNCLVCFPKMMALQELEIDGTDAFSKHSVSFGDFTYRDIFPQLIALRISIWAQINLRWNQFFHVKSPVWTLSELKLPGELCDRTMMACVSAAFPNLKKLYISVYSVTLDSMEMIFESMPQLEELTVTKFPSLWDRSEKNIDHILTGIRDCDKLGKENAALNKVTDDELMTMKDGPGLTNLKSTWFNI